MREKIIRTIRDIFLGDDRVNAFWLEGSDGLGIADEYSDLDIWLDVADGSEQAILARAAEALAGLAPLDFDQTYDHPHPKIAQRVLHLSGTSPFLYIDLCLQSHSRGAEGCTFVEGDIAELPLVIFDKCAVVKMIPEPPADREALRRAYDECLLTWAQRPRVTKYLHRELYLEAHAYYMKYVAGQVVLMARMLFTPRHLEYGLVHLSGHVPGEHKARLEALYKVGSLKEISRKLPEADAYFSELRRRVEETYGF